MDISKINYIILSLLILQTVYRNIKVTWKKNNKIEYYGEATITKKITNQEYQNTMYSFRIELDNGIRLVNKVDLDVYNKYDESEKVYVILDAQKENIISLFQSKHMMSEYVDNQKKTAMGSYMDWN